MFIRLLFGVALILIGIVVAWIGLNERDVAAMSTQAPEEISLEKLLARGPIGNPNIILTDFSLCRDIVYHLHQPRVWIPIVPGDIDDFPERLALVHALLVSNNVQNQEELRLRCAKPKLPALVANRLGGLMDDE